MNEASALGQAYDLRYQQSLLPIAVRLEELLREQLAGQARIDRITSRAKSPARFEEKAAKLQNGVPKYTRPLDQIQDQIGARIVVFYSLDVDLITHEIERYYRHIERQQLEPEDSWTFGYTGNHSILLLPREVIPPDIAVSDAPEFFELQVKTLWQHAWSEANHDLGYKPLVELTSEQQRLLAFTAAQAWGADRVFSELFVHLGGPQTSR